MSVTTVKNDELLFKDGQDTILRIKEDISDNVFSVQVYGDISTAFLADFEDEMLTILTLRKDIRLDLSNVENACGGLLNVLLFIQKEMDRVHQGTMRLVAPSRPVQRLLDENGFYDLLDIAVR